MLDFQMNYQTSLLFLFKTPMNLISIAVSFIFQGYTYHFFNPQFWSLFSGQEATQL